MMTLGENKWQAFCEASERWRVRNCGCPLFLRPKIVVVVQAIPQKRVGQRSVEQIVDLPVPQVVVRSSVSRHRERAGSTCRGGNCGSFKIWLVYQGRIQERCSDESVDVPVIRIMEDIPECTIITRAEPALWCKMQTCSRLRFMRKLWK